MKQNQEKISLNVINKSILAKKCNIECTGLTGSDRAYLVSKIYAKHQVPIVVIVPSQKEAHRYLEDLRFFLSNGKANIFYFPHYNILPFKHISYHNETASERINTLYNLIEGQLPSIVITTVDALLQKIMPKHMLSDYAELIMEGEEIDRDFLIKKLVSGGYVSSRLVEEAGDFSVRGGILDIFSPLYHDPVRIEFFADTVESIRFFSAVNQLTIKNIPEAVILPVREAVLEKQNLDRVVGNIREQSSILGLPVTTIRKIVDQVKTECIFPGIESMLPLIYPEPATLFDYIPGNAVYILSEPTDLSGSAKQFSEQAVKNFLTAREKSRLCVEPEKIYMGWSDVKDILKKKNRIYFKMLSVSKGLSDHEASSRQLDFFIKDNSDVSIELRQRTGKDLLSPLANWINGKKQSGYATFIICSTFSQAKRVRSLLLNYGIQLAPAQPFDGTKIVKKSVRLCTGRVSSGFVWPDEYVAIITEDEIFGPKRRTRKKAEPKIQRALIEFEDLTKGDLIVHTQYGIGKYEGLVKLKHDGANNDFLLIIYKGDDRLYLPVDRMNMVQKYMGVDGLKPSLDKMGGKAWERIKARVKKSTKKIAKELLSIYAKRRVKKGYACQSMDEDFHDFEAGFMYEETPDQMKAIENVLEDMEKPMPMDRLVCGDVGYGKTEVALRASLLAVNNGKQVAVLVPTTVLAEQHFSTFTGRFDRYAVNIACLSRFRSLSKQRQIISDLKSGKTDIVIGTHRLLQKDVAFKDLGLFIIDEEQRFGVRHKEKLKKLRATVDVLALTATPIPRTLHMSLMGIHDISLISTPPEHRKSIITYICNFDESVIAEAIKKELGRKGQIFFVHNNISNIWNMAKRLQELVPQVRLDVAHGRLGEDELENVMLRFMRKEIDLLVCTTIIESGLDIPSANTILINRADRFGLAQIYQLRGRVGRIDQQAYAYLIIPDESLLGKDARKRLKVLMEHSDLGSGYQIAMSDLKIRGGGTILGASQSGHIAAVGYDMFLKLMEDSISELKGEPVEEKLEPEINVIMPAYFSETYIPDIDQRLSAYRRLAKMVRVGEISDLKVELTDRFGPLPKEASNLLLKIMLKVLASKAGAMRLDLTENRLLLSFSGAHQKNPIGIIDLVNSDRKRYKFLPNHVLKAKLLKSNTLGLLRQSKNILKDVAQHVNP